MSTRLRPPSFSSWAASSTRAARICVVCAAACVAAAAYGQSAPSSPADFRVNGVAAPAPTATTFPDATNTGVPAGVTLRASSSVVSTAAGQIIDALNVTGTVEIRHNNVTLRRSKISGRNWVIVNIADGVTGAVVEDCEIDGGGYNGTSGNIGVLGQVTLRRSRVSGVENAIVPYSNSLIEANWVHNLEAPGADPHSDGLPLQGGQSNVIIRGNTIDMGGTPGGNAQVFLNGYYGPNDNVLFDRNLFVGSSYVGFNIYSVQSSNFHPVSNIRFTNNVIQRARWGYIYPGDNNTPYVVKIAEWTNNRDYATGQVIPLSW
jgi:hypothetical protein